MIYPITKAVFANLLLPMLYFPLNIFLPMLKNHLWALSAEQLLNLNGFLGQSYKANFGINYTKNRLSKLNFTLNYINFDVIYAKKSFIGLTPGRKQVERNVCLLEVGNGA